MPDRGYRALKRAAAHFAICAAAVAAVPLIASAQSYCWGDCPADAVSICTGIILDGYCVDDPTPAQLDRYNSQQQVERERQERETRERVVRETEFRRQVDLEVVRLGENRRAEAERFVRMRQDAEAARARAVAPPPPRPRQCTQRQGVQPVSATAATREAAQASVARSRATPGGSETIVANSVSGSSCSQRNVIDMPRPPVGTCLACITQQQAVALGWVPGQGWPPPRVEWVCTASVTYTAERCGSGSSTVMAQ